MKKVQIKTNPNAKLYLQILNGIFNLTERELEVASKFLELYWIEKNNVFTVNHKKKIANELSIKNFNSLNIYIKTFVNKRLIVKEPYGYSFKSIFNKDEEGIAFIWKKDS